MKNHFHIKIKAIAVIAALLLCASSAWAEEIKKHVVGRGETLSSIAAKYNVSQEEIVKLNPEAAQFLYVGMELKIPQKIQAQTLQQAEISARTSQKSASKPTTNSEKYHSHHSELLEGEIFGGISINKTVGDDAKNISSKMGFHIGVSGRYLFSEQLFTEISLAIASKGYKTGSASSSGDQWNEDGGNYDSESDIHMTTYNLDIPISIGYKLALSESSNLRIKVGPYLTYAISGTCKETGYTTIYPDIHSSETEHINNKTKLKDMDNYKRFGAGLNIGIGYEMSRFSISATYQRGLTNLIKDKEIYEQNILIGIGYRF